MSIKEGRLLHFEATPSTILTMKALYVKDIKPGNTVSNVPFVVIKVEKKVTKNNKEYLDVTIGDKTGSLVAKVWGEKYEACSADGLQEGVVALVTGAASEFMGKVQMVVSMAIISDKYDEDDFVPVSKKNIDEMMNYLHTVVSAIGDRHIKKLLTNMFSDEQFVNKFKKTPAALKHHHAFVGGLLEHTIELIEFGMSMAEVYQPCNRDLVVAGAILHDIGKVEEIVWRNMAIEYSDRGKLLGHVQIGIQTLEKYKPEGFDGECLQLLQHIILSHHGKLEYGAIVVPATIEAKIVSLADDASAKLRSYMSLYEDGLANGSSFSEYNRALETAVYLKEYQSAVENLMGETQAINDKLKQLELI
jgi:3'-5' exoribonuclease